jgi:hypothetical protein
MTGDQLKKWMKNGNKTVKELSLALNVSTQAIYEQRALGDKPLSDSFQMKLIKAGYTDTTGTLPKTQDELNTETLLLMKELKVAIQQQTEMLTLLANKILRD